MNTFSVIYTSLFSNIIFGVVLILVLLILIPFSLIYVCNTVEPLLRGHPNERPTPLERPLDNVNLNINVLITTSDERPPLLKGHFSAAEGVASQEGFHCIKK